MKLLVMSDLHNDIGKMPAVVDGRRIDEQADVIVLAGDIHEGVQAPMWARETFPDKPIVMVCGNHEFYGREWRRNLRKIRVKAESLGIHFLENDTAEIEGVRFLGCTLWTDFSLFGETQRSTSMAEARAQMNDYHLIKLDRKPGENQDWREFRSVKLMPELSRRRHRESVQWLDEQLSHGDLAKTVVVTHHAPLARSIPRYYESNSLSPAYASNLDHLMGRSALWIHGHIHDRIDYMAGDTRVVANPRGYPRHSGKNENEAFDPFFTVEV